MRVKISIAAHDMSILFADNASDGFAGETFIERCKRLKGTADYQINIVNAIVSFSQQFNIPVWKYRVQVVEGFKVGLETALSSCFEECWKSLIAT